MRLVIDDPTSSATQVISAWEIFPGKWCVDDLIDLIEGGLQVRPEGWDAPKSIPHGAIEDFCFALLDLLEEAEKPILCYAAE